MQTWSYPNLSPKNTVPLYSFLSNITTLSLSTGILPTVLIVLYCVQVSVEHLWWSELFRSTLSSSFRSQNSKPARSTYSHVCRYTVVNFCCFLTLLFNLCLISAFIKSVPSTANIRFGHVNFWQCICKWVCHCNLTGSVWNGVQHLRCGRGGTRTQRSCWCNWRNYQTISIDRYQAVDIHDRGNVKRSWWNA